MELSRQGDVVLRKLDDLPADAQPVADQDEGRVLAYGEKTGHMHELTGGEVYERQNGDKVVQVDSPARLVHQEHSHIDVPPGIYEVVLQTTYEPDGSVQEESRGSSEGKSRQLPDVLDRFRSSSESRSSGSRRRSID